MHELFKFKGKDGSLGYERGRIYMLFVIGSDKPTIITPHYCPYDSWELFLQNWTRVK